MRYFLQRDGASYGPYSLDEIRQFQSQNRIGPNDLLRREDSQQWLPWQQAIAQAAAPVAYNPPQPQQQAYGGFGQQPQPQFQQPYPQQPYPQQPYGQQPQPGGAGPMPPDFPWWAVLLIGFLCSLFPLFWLFKEASFVNRIDPRSGVVGKLAIGFGCYVVGLICMVMVGAFAREIDRDLQPFVAIFGGLIILAGVVFLLTGTFGMRRAIHTYYNTVEPMGVNLMGTGPFLLTLFFAVYYFQHQFTEIAAKKKALGHR
jgi:hypothetical protein